MTIILSPKTHFAQEGGNLNTSTNNNKEAKIYVKYAADTCGSWLVVSTYNMPDHHILTLSCVKSEEVASSGLAASPPRNIILKVTALKLKGG